MTAPPIAPPAARTPPPALAAPKNPAPNCVTAPAILRLATAASIGKTGLRDFPIFIKALAREIETSAKFLKVELSVNSLNRAENSFLTLASLTASVSCAFAASIVRDAEPACATAMAA